MGVVAKGASEARENFSMFLDESEKRPGFISRRRSTYVVIPSSVIEKIAPLKIMVAYCHDDMGTGRVYYTKNHIFPDVVGWGDTKAQALSSFIDGLKDFCNIFYEDFYSFSRAPNRQEQIFPVLAILSIMSNGGDISEIIEVGGN